MASTRDRIRDAALNLFVDKGYTATSIADIERAAGLAPRTGGFYRHFASKEELAAEIGATSIIETREDLGFTGALPLGDTRAELVLIARGYLKAVERQARFASLIAEVRHLPKIQELEERVSRDLLDALREWIAPKAGAHGLSRLELDVLIMNVFGGWIFYLTRRGSDVIPGLDDETMLRQWADLWSEILDGRR